MYKGASRFQQRRSESGRASDSFSRGGRAKRKKTKLGSAQLKNWMAYIRRCREGKVMPRLPAEVFAALKRRGLLR